MPMPAFNSEAKKIVKQMQSSQWTSHKLFTNDNHDDEDDDNDDDDDDGDNSNNDYDNDDDDNYYDYNVICMHDGL